MTRNFIVTGGNTGIGEAVATRITGNSDHQVVIVSRSHKKGQAALKRIRAVSANNNVELVLGDLATIKGCHDLADALLGQMASIHVLINNAGIMPLQRELNADGIESAFMVNHMAPFILSLRLRERLQENAPARIVQVGAGLYALGAVDLTSLPYGHDFERRFTYASTKMCCLMASLEMAKRFAGTGITVNVVHPGVTPTGLIKSRQVWDANPYITGDVTDTARAPVRLACNSEFEDISGFYFNRFDAEEPIQACRNKALVDAIWDFSRRLAFTP
jgi:NAD(P)-dependent dehydrogenase (short-subunit alcohol dehydrogenase family)